MCLQVFSYVLHIVGSTLDQSLPRVTEKTILFYFIKDLVTFHRRHCHDLGYHQNFGGIDRVNIFLPSEIIKLAYEGHYEFPNLCNCKYTRPVTAGAWVKKKMPTFINKLPLYLDTDEKWTYAVYNCVCSHKFIETM